MNQSDRYSLATILGGRMHPNGIPEWVPWDTSRLHWWIEDHIDLIRPVTGDRKVQTSEELETAMKEPMGVAPTRKVWIHEEIEAEAQQVWEIGRT